MINKSRQALRPGKRPDGQQRGAVSDCLCSSFPQLAELLINICVRSLAESQLSLSLFLPASIKQPPPKDRCATLRETFTDEAPVRGSFAIHFSKATFSAPNGSCKFGQIYVESNSFACSSQELQITGFACILGAKLSLASAAESKTISE